MNTGGLQEEMIEKLKDQVKLLEAGRLVRVQDNHKLRQRIAELERELRYSFDSINALEKSLAMSNPEDIERDNQCRRSIL